MNAPVLEDKDNNALLDPEFYISAAEQHGLDEDPDHEVGDLQAFFRAAWEVMTPQQRANFALLNEVKSCVEAAICMDYAEEYADEQDQIKDTFLDLTIDGKPEKFIGVEISGVRFETDSDICVDNDAPQFFSAYLKHQEGGVVAVADFVSAQDALDFAHRAEAKYGFPLDNRIKDEFFEAVSPARPRM